MDEKPKCSHTVDIAPIKQQPSPNDQVESQEDSLILPEELTPATKTQTLLIQPEELTPTAKTQTLLIQPEEQILAAKIQTLLIQTEELTPAAKIQTLLIQPEELTPAAKTQTLLIQPEELIPAAKIQTLLIQPEELTPAAKTQTLLIQPEELTPAGKTQTLLIQPEELTPAAKTQTLLIQPEELTPAAKIQTLLIQPEELTPAAKTQTLLIQPEELTPAAKTQTLPIQPEELTAAAKTQTVLLKELQASSEVETSPKTQLKLTIDQPIYLLEQKINSKDQPEFSGDQQSFSKHQPAFSENQPTHSKDQSNNSKDQPTFSKTQTVDKLALTASLTKIYIDSMKVGSTSSREFLIAPKVEIDKSEGESSLTKEQTTLIMTKYTAVSEACHINKDHFLSTNAPLKITSSTHSRSLITNKPMSQFPASATLTLPIGQPLSLFLQALSKLNESSLALTVLPFRLHSSPNLSKICNVVSGDITPPDSLTSAPPTYSFVLRQMAVRRRPRFMGTFFPSPSFVQHAPPPTYTGAFDVYIEPALPPPPARVYSFGFTSMPVVCQECGFTGMTLIKSRVTICTHLCAITLCLLCCWICAPLPYILSSCKDVYHYCRNCRTFLGMYCPTNPEAAYTGP